jgi:hypothetical protein
MLIRSLLSNIFKRGKNEKALLIRFFVLMTQRYQPDAETLNIEVDATETDYRGIRPSNSMRRSLSCGVWHDIKITVCYS